MLPHFQRNLPDSKLAFWAVSHCNTLNKRENYVKQLLDFINIDIYGHCGSLSVPCGNPMNTGPIDCWSEAFSGKYALPITFFKHVYAFAPYVGISFTLLLRTTIALIMSQRSYTEH